MYCAEERSGLVVCLSEEQSEGSVSRDNEDTSKGKFVARRNTAQKGSGHQSSSINSIVELYMNYSLAKKTNYMVCVSPHNKISGQKTKVAPATRTLQFCYLNSIIKIQAHY